MGTADELALDVLLNMLLGFSAEVAGDTGLSSEIWNTLCTLRLHGSSSRKATELICSSTLKRPIHQGSSLGDPLNFSLMFAVLRKK
jgi:hypothetical protein